MSPGSMLIRHAGRVSASGTAGGLLDLDAERLLERSMQI